MAAGGRIKDPSFIAEALRELLANQEEFPIKVEGTKTLPYTASMLKVAGGGIILKLLRPLPPAMAEGALFEMVFASQNKRYEGRIRFLGREGYLQYRFEAPDFLTVSDRRTCKRYPLRPRENFYVAAQDSQVPGHGLSGTLLNLSMGGLAFRVDRMIRLDDGMPLPPHAGLFERGMALSLLRVRGFPKGEVLETRGQVARAEDRDSATHLGIQFVGMSDAEKARLTRFLETRERQASQGSGGLRAETGAMAWPPGAPARDSRDEAAAGQEPQAPAPEPPLPAEAAGLNSLRILDRRCARLILAGPAGEDRDMAMKNLQEAGFARFEPVQDLFAAHALWKGAAAAPPRGLLVDLQPSCAEGLEPLAAVRHMEPLLRSFGELPIFFVTRTPDPMLDLMARPGFGALALEQEEGETWAASLDAVF